MSYRANGQSTGVVTVEFQRSEDAGRAYTQYNNRLIDSKRPLKIEVVVDPARAQAAAPAPAPAPAAQQPRKSGRGRGRGGRARRPSRPVKSAEDLDAEMEGASLLTGLHSPGCRERAGAASPGSPVEVVVIYFLWSVALTCCLLMSVSPSLQADGGDPALESDAVAPLILAQVTSPLVDSGTFQVDEPGTLARSHLEELVADVHRCAPSDYATLINIALTTHRILLDHRAGGRVYDGFGDCGGFLVVIQLLAALGHNDERQVDSHEARSQRVRLLHLALTLVGDATTYSTANLYTFGTMVTWSGLSASLALAAEAHEGQLSIDVIGGLFGLAIGNVAAGVASFTHAWNGVTRAENHSGQVVVHPGAVAAAFNLATTPRLKKVAYIILDDLLNGHPRNALLVARTPLASELLHAIDNHDELFTLRKRILMRLLSDGIKPSDIRCILKQDTPSEHVLELLRNVAKSAHHPRAIVLGSGSLYLGALPHPFPNADASSSGYSLSFSVRLDTDATIVQIGTQGNFLRILTSDRVLCIDQGSENTRTKLERTELKLGTWHSVVITHLRSAPQTRSTLHAYIDGHRACSVALAYPPQMPEPVPMLCGAGGNFSLGPLLLIDGVLPSSLPLLLHELSPQYAGNFQSALSRFLTPFGRASVEERFTELAQRGARRGSRTLDALRTALHGPAPDIFPLGRFYVHLDAGCTKQTPNGLVMLNKAYASAQDAISASSGHAELLGVPTFSVPSGIDDSVWLSGGTIALLQVIRNSPTPRLLSLSLRLFLDLVSTSWRLAEDAERNKSYELLAVCLSDKVGKIELDVLHQLVNAAGTEPLANTSLYRAVLLEPQIWTRTSLDVQKAYLKHFSVICTPRNAEKLTRLPVVKCVVVFARSTSVEDLCPFLREATCACLQAAFSVGGVQALFLHISAVLSGTYILEEALEPLHVRTTEDIPSRQKYLPTHERISCRITTSLLLGVVDAAASDPIALARLARTVSAKWILLLLRPGAVLSYAVPTIELVCLLLAEGVFMRKFHYAGGFRILDHMLPHYWYEPSVIPWLWTLFFAEERPTRATLYATFVPRKSWPRPDVPLVRHGVVLRTILACIERGIKTACAPPLRRRRSLPELHEMNKIAATETALSLIEDSVVLLARHAAHPEVQKLLLHPQAVLTILATIKSSICETYSCWLVDKLLDILTMCLCTAILQSGSIAPLNIVHTSMPVPDPLVQSRLCTRVYQRLLVHVIHAMRVGPVYRSTMSIMCGLLELVSNESLRDASLQQSIFTLGGFILAKADFSRLAISTRDQLLLSLQRNVLHALACVSNGIVGADAFTFCIKYPQLLLVDDGVFVECVLNRALKSSNPRAARTVRFITEHHPSLSVDPNAYQQEWDTVLTGQTKFLASLVQESARQLYTSVGQMSSRTNMVLSSHAKMESWHSAIVDAERVRFGRLAQDTRTDFEYARRIWRCIDECKYMEHTRLWRIDPTEGPNRTRAKLQPVAPRKPPALPQNPISAPAHQTELEALGDDSADAPAVLDADASTNGVTVTFDPDSSVMVDTIPDVPQEQPQETSADDFEDKFRSVMRTLKRGDVIEHIFNTSRVVGIDAQGTLLVIGKDYIYMLNNYFQRPNGELVSIADAPQEERDALVVATRPEGTNALNLVRVVEGDEPARCWPWNSVQSVFRRAWLHRRTALELFFADGQSTLLVLSKSALAEELYSVFRSKVPEAVAAAEELADGIHQQSGISQSLTNTRLTAAVLRRSGSTSNCDTAAWRAGEISNYQYLAALNTLAGRTFNDLTQFPVFPWVLADYTSASLDLNDEKTFRDFSLPMGAQTPRRREEFIERYNQLQEVGIDPFHYGTHYSTASSVCGFLVRMLPYSDILVELQGGSFDLADRTFSSIGRTWYSASALSRGDVRELIPEFFSLPEMFENPNHFDFGITQNGARIDCVELPPWAHDDPVLFVYRHREALESDYVSAHLHEWIDLIFGFKGHGAEAVRNTNVFHPLSYADSIDLESIESPLEREAAAQVIHNFGQTPRALFTKPHPPKTKKVPLEPWSANAHFTCYVELIVRSAAPVFSAGCRVGHIYGDPPTHACSAHSLVLSKLGLCLQTGFIDRSIRMMRLGDKQYRFVAMLEHATLGNVTVIHEVSESEILIGSSDGVAQIFTLTRGPLLVLDCFLSQHTDAILCAFVSRPWSVVVTGSADKTATMCVINTNQLGSQQTATCPHSPWFRRRSPSCCG